MTDLIRRLVTWAVTPLKEHSADPHPAFTPPWPGPTPLPAHRSPYVPADTPLDTTATSPVRPYVIVHEQRLAAPALEAA
ncbi:hypothetical protein [Streptomyces sp. NPDC018693]|uniref:hypothetical protein n=1 Tax=unclassified Streptomyces TaxID=2593676 RepID=UPI00379B9889